MSTNILVFFSLLVVILFFSQPPHNVPYSFVQKSDNKLSISLTCNRAQDSMALIAFHSVFTNSNVLNWTFSDPIDTWDGVFDTNSDGCIDSIKIRNKGLIGELDAASINFSSLKHLDLLGNDITGEIPQEISNLSELITINFSDNDITNPSYSSLAQITSLKIVDFDRNTFEEGVSVADLCGSLSLSYLSLRTTGMTENIPIDIISCQTSLEYLDLAFNSLTGEIPIKIKKLKSLEELHLNGNYQLQGTVPDSLWFLSNLRRINLSLTSLSGQIPETIENLQNLNFLWLEDASFEGAIPETMLSPPNLFGVNIKGNRIDSIPDFSEFEDNNLIFFYVDGNRLTFDDILPNLNLVGDFTYSNQDSIYIDTTFFVTLGQTLTIDLGIDKAINNNEYKWYRDQMFLATTTSNILEINNFQDPDAGTYRCEVRNPEAPDLVLHSKPIEVIIQDCRIRDSLALLDFASQFSIDPSRLSDTTTYFDIGLGYETNVPNPEGNWDFNEPLDSLYGVELNDDGCVISLILPSYELSGSIPESIGNLQSLEKLYLENNNITGVIPNSLYTLTQLKELVLRKNNIEGIISPNISNLNSLEGIDIKNNSLSEGIPPEIGDLSQLTLLYLAGNSLEGNIPNHVTNLVELTHLDLNSNDLSGPIPDSIGRLKNLKFLYLHNNRLSGELPSSFIELESLFQIILANNMFSGVLPENIDQLQSLGFLQLENNSFEGSIPESITNLPLQTIRLNDNNFLGAFPDLSHLNIRSIRIDNNSFDLFPNHSEIVSWDTTAAVWTGCQVQNNKLTFDDILPNMPIMDTTVWTYAPQDSIFSDTTINVSIGSNLEIDLGIDESLNSSFSSIYTWFKETDSISTVGVNNFQLINIQPDDAGIYHVEINNPSAPNLTLYSKPIEIIVLPVDTVFNFQTTCNIDEVSQKPDTTVIVNRVGTDSIIIITVTSLSSPSISNEKLVAYYPFDNNANDMSGWGNHGVVNSASPSSDRFGNEDCSYELDGMDDFIRIPHQEWINFSVYDTFAISLWVQIEPQIDFNTQHNEVLIKWLDGSVNPYPYSIRFNNEASTASGQLECGIYGANQDCTNIIRSPDTIDLRDGRMHHIVYLKENNKFSFYVDNDLVESNIKNINCQVRNEVPLFIGRRGTDVGDRLYFKGKVDDLRIYNRALTNQEISKIYFENNLKSIEIDTVICSSESFFVGSNEYNTTGIYFDTLSNANGCDSIIITNLWVEPEVEIEVLDDEYFTRTDSVLIFSPTENDNLSSSWIITLIDSTDFGELSFINDSTFSYQSNSNEEDFDIFEYEICNVSSCPQICDIGVVKININHLERQEQYNPILTPSNFDGIHDGLSFKSLDNYPQSKLTIFNRYGNRIIQIENYENNEWGGKYKGEFLPDGTYYYILELGDGEKLISGFITILSN